MANNTTIVVIIIVAVLIVAILGYVWYTQTYTTVPTSQNQNPQTNPPITTIPSTTPSTPSSPAETTPKTYNIDIANFAFSPSSLTIKKGDMVIWTNEDSVAHTVTSDSGSELSSPLISKGRMYSHTIDTAGTYNYHCTPHPNMKATIIVE